MYIEEPQHIGSGKSTYMYWQRKMIKSQSLLSTNFSQKCKDQNVEILMIFLPPFYLYCQYNPEALTSSPGMTYLAGINTDKSSAVKCLLMMFLEGWIPRTWASSLAPNEGSRTNKAPWTPLSLKLSAYSYAYKTDINNFIYTHSNFLSFS